MPQVADHVLQRPGERWPHRIAGHPDPDLIQPRRQEMGAFTASAQAS